VLPVFFFLVFAIIEFGHAQMVIHVMQSACRNGARIGSTEGATTSEVTEHVNRIMASAFKTATASTFVLDASQFDSSSTPPTTGAAMKALPAMELLNAKPRQMFVVRATIPYNDIALVPMPFMSGVVLDGQAIMRHE
jgi:Flp pilus assembly protein TadG